MMLFPQSNWTYLNLFTHFFLWVRFLFDRTSSWSRFWCHTLFWIWEILFFGFRFTGFASLRFHWLNWFDRFNRFPWRIIHFVWTQWSIPLHLFRLFPRFLIATSSFSHGIKGVVKSHHIKSCASQLFCGAAMIMVVVWIIEFLT